MNWLKNLYTRTLKIAARYTGTFIIIMVLNQLLFFGMCLNPICLVAAMPHVLFLTVLIGSWVNKEDNWGKDIKSDYSSSTKTVKASQPIKSTKTEVPPTVIENMKSDDNASPLCPKCNSSMALRTAKRGRHAGNQFYGCNQWPKCNGIVNL